MVVLANSGAVMVSICSGPIFEYAELIEERITTFLEVLKSICKKHVYTCIPWP